LFGSQGFQVILAARRLDRLQEISTQITSAGGIAIPIRTDLTRPEDLQLLIDGTIKQFGQIDLLINNAGFGRIIPLIEMEPTADILSQLEVNLISPIRLSQLVIPPMAKRRQGHIINIASLASFLGVPNYTIYAATKFGLRGFSEALRREVMGLGIQVSAVYPGSVRTEFSRHMGRKKKPRFTTPDWLVLSSEDVAKTILSVAQNPRPATVIPRILRPILFIGLNFPTLADWLINWRYVPPQH
jgi:short-subunit dehydrogenase